MTKKKMKPMSTFMVDVRFGTKLTHRSTAVIFLLVISMYVFCIVGVQINWSNKTSLTSNQNCDNRDKDDCHRTTNGPPVDKNQDNKRFFDARRWFYLIGITTDNSKEKSDFNKASDRKDCFLPDKLVQPGMPMVHSVFADTVSRQVIIIGALRSKSDSWHGELFRCEHAVDTFTQIVTFSDPILRDFKRFGADPNFGVVITCPIPDTLLDRQYFMMNLRRVSKPELSYNNIRVCQGAPKTSPKHVLTMCTMTKNMDRYIPNWIDYHKLLGVEHVYIYDNAAPSTLPQTSKRYVDSGFLTIIPWAHTAMPNKTHREAQIASENDCMWRYKHTSQWMIKVDVDEFLQPMDPNRTKITDYLHDDNYDYNKLGSLRVLNWFFCRHPQINYTGLKPLESNQSVFERNLVRHRRASSINIGRDKAIARPANIHYYKIHGVKLGGDTLTFSPAKEMRLVHYREDNPRHPEFCPGRKWHLDIDFSMIRLWYRLHGANMVEAEKHFNVMQDLIRNSGQTKNDTKKQK